MSNVVSFKRDGKYLLKRAALNRKNGRYLDALRLTRRAVETEPENVEGWMSMAQTLCEMGCYEQSNRILCLMLSVPGAPADCYYGMSCNFSGMYNQRAAFGAIVSLIAVEPNSLSREDVVSHLNELILMRIDDEYDERTNKRIAGLCRRAEALLKNSNAHIAVGFAQRAYELDRENDDAARVYAASLMATGETEKALNVINAALDNSDASLETILQAVRIYNQASDPLKAKSVAAPLLHNDYFMGKELLICLRVACETDDDEAVSKYATKAMRMAPFNTRLMHVCAVNRVRLGRPNEQAIAFWSRALTIDPDDVIARYYLNAINNATISRDISYDYELPRRESQEYLALLKSAQLMSDDELENELARRGDLRYACLWAIQTGKDELVFARELLARSKSAWAKRMLAESRVDMFEASFSSIKGGSFSNQSVQKIGNAVIPHRLEHALKFAFETALKSRGEGNIVYLYEALAPISQEKGLERFGDIRAWATVLAYAAFISMGEKRTIEDVAALMECPVRRAKRCLRVYEARGGLNENN